MRDILRWKAGGFFFKYSYEFFSDYPPLLFRVRHPAKLTEEPPRGIYVIELDAHPVPKRGEDLFCLILPQQAVIHEDRVQLIPYGFVQKSNHHGRIHTPDRAATTCAPAARSLTRSQVVSTNEAIVQSGLSPAILYRKFFKMVVPSGVCTTSG